MYGKDESHTKSSEHSHEQRMAPLTAADVLTAGEVADLLRMPRSSVEDLARRGLVPSRKVGRRRLFVRSRVEAMLLEDA
jgi:excisionase family DNA binding protein